MSERGGEAAGEGVSFTNLDKELFTGAGATKGDLVEYLDAVSDRIIPVLRDRPLSVIRVHRGQEAFMQKNLPKYTPAWVPRVRFWAESSKRDVTYGMGNDRRTLLWFANQRAVEYHPALAVADHPERPTHLVLDLDPPDAEAFPMAVRAARLVRQALADVGLEGAVKTSGAKGVHVFVPSTSRRPRTTPPPPPVPSPPGLLVSTLPSPPPLSSRTNGAGRCSSTRHGSAGRR